MLLHSVTMWYDCFLRSGGYEIIHFPPQFWRDDPWYQPILSRGDLSPSLHLLWWYDVSQFGHLHKCLGFTSYQWQAIIHDISQFCPGETPATICNLRWYGISWFGHLLAWSWFQNISMTNDDPRYQAILSREDLSQSLQLEVSHNLDTYIVTVAPSSGDLCKESW